MLTGVVKTTFSPHSFSSHPPLLNNSSRLCTMLGRLTQLPFKLIKYRHKLQSLKSLSGLINRNACTKLMYLHFLLLVFCALCKNAPCCRFIQAKALSGQCALLSSFERHNHQCASSVGQFAYLFAGYVISLHVFM